MATTLQKRILGRLDALGRTAAEVSRDAGFDANFIRDVLRGKKKNVHAANLDKLAQALQCDPRYLTSHETSAERSARFTAVRIVGELTSKVWREEDDDDLNLAFKAKSDIQPFRDVTAIPADPRFEPLAQADYLVSDDSIDLFARKGQFVRAVYLVGYPWPIRAGDLVIVKRYRGSLVQTTCRRIQPGKDGNTEYCPVSSSRAWKVVRLSDVLAEERGGLWVIAKALFVHEHEFPNREVIAKKNLGGGFLPKNS